MKKIHQFLSMGWFLRFSLIILLLSCCNITLPVNSQAAPILNFSDIVSGPKNGNTDGAGGLTSAQHGAIITVWGDSLGSSQGTSKIFVGSVEAAHIYYWKDADGRLPSGPADLKTYHKMQEIAFSVPAGAIDGANTIKVNVGGVDSNTLPFTVRSGGIKFIKAGGSDSTGNGTWSSPYATINNVFAGGNGKLSAGDTVYSVGVGSTAGVKVGGDATVAGTASNPISLIAYPNTVVALSGSAGGTAVIENWYPSNRHNAYVNFSKLSVTAYGNDTGSGSSANGMNVVPYNRVVGLMITGPTVYGGYGGAIAGTEGVPQGGVYLGIYMHHYGYATPYAYSWDNSTWTSPPYNGVGAACTNCTSVDRFQHLYYITNRIATRAEAYEIAWNNLVDNPILTGIHIYDMGDAAGWNGTLKVHHNVVKNQRGAAIDVSFPASSPIEIHDNLVIVDTSEAYNIGPAYSIQGGAIAKVYNNTVYGYGSVNILQPASMDYKNNIMVDTRGIQFINGTPTTQSNNLFYSTASTPTPSWATGAITANPLFTNAAGYDFSLNTSSPAKSAGTNTVIGTAPTDFWGQARQASSVNTGAFGVSGNTPTPPTNVKGGWK